MAAGDMESADSSSSGTAPEQLQAQSAVDPDITEDEMEGDSGLGNSAEATAEGENEAEGEEEEKSAAASLSTTQRAAPRKRRSKKLGWGSSKKKKLRNQMSWQEKKARMAAKAAAAAAAAEEAQQTTAALTDGAQQSADAATETADEPEVKQEELAETMQEDAASESVKAPDEVVEKTERGRPLRASIKARQKQLEEERKAEEEGRKRRRQEKMLAQARGRTKVKKEEPATPTETQPLSLSAPPPPLSSLSSLPSSSSTHPLPPPKPPALLRRERDKSRVVPSHCYGVDWRCVAKLTDCVYTQLHSTQSSVIDWSVVSDMMANVVPLSSDECQLLWRCIAYGMDDEGYGRWKRLDFDYEDEADSDIDVELPGYDETGVADVRSVVKSSQLRHCAKEDTMDEWTTQHDSALLHVLAIWANKSRQQQQTHTATPTLTPHIALSLTSLPLSTAVLPHLPSLDSDWHYIASLFEHFAAVHKSPTFLHARFAALTRMAFTRDGTGESGKEERARLRESVLAVLGVDEGVDGRQWLLHSGGRNWDEKREVVDRRRRLHHQRRKNGSGTSNGQKQPPISTYHAVKSAGAEEKMEVKRSDAPIDMATVEMAVDGSGSSQSQDAKLDSMEIADRATTENGVNDVDSTEAAGTETTVNGSETGAGSEAVPMPLTDSADTGIASQ